MTFKRAKHLHVITILFGFNQLLAYHKSLSLDSVWLWVLPSCFCSSVNLLLVHCRFPTCWKSPKSSEKYPILRSITIISNRRRVYLHPVQTITLHHTRVFKMLSICGSLLAATATYIWCMKYNHKWDGSKRRQSK